MNHNDAIFNKNLPAQGTYEDFEHSFVPSKQVYTIINILSKRVSFPSTVQILV